MKTFDLFRAIDRWVGIPLCAFFSLFAPLKWLWIRVFPPRPFKKILIIKLIEIGAVVHAYPFLKKIQEDYPAAEIYILTFSKNREIFNLFSRSLKIKEIITINEEGLWHLTADLWQTIWRVVVLRPCLTVDLEFFSRASALLSFFSGAPKTVGFYAYGFEGLYRGDFLSHKVAYNPLVHTSVNYLSLAQALKEPFKNSPEAYQFIDRSSLSFPVYTHDPQVRQSLSIFNLPQNKCIFLMNMGEGNIPLREWPLENFKRVAEEILKDSQNVVLLVGAQSGQQKAQDLMEELEHERLLNYCGKTSLLQLMEIFMLSHALIANDGGLGHLAMMTSIKKYILYGPETPQVFSPLGPHTHVFYSHWPCSPCLSALNHRYSACRDNQCLKAIKPDEVIKIVLANQSP